MPPLIFGTEVTPCPVRIFLLVLLATLVIMWVVAGPQIESLERQFLKKRLFEHYEVPRLSLFYL